MICYFAKRDMTILMHASTGLRRGVYIYDDKKVENIKTGQDTISFYLRYGFGNRKKAEAAAEVGNYILKKSDNDEFYTIIDSDSNPIKREIYIYAEAAGLDMIGEMCEAYEAPAPMTLAQYASRWLYDTGFEVGVDESDGATMALAWEDSETATARILSTAEQFGMEVSYRYDIHRLSIKHKYIDFHTKRGSTVYEPLRRGRDFENFRIKKSIENIATALRVTGGTPDGAGIHKDSDNTYTWVKFSEYSDGYDDENSASMQDDPNGMQFIGISARHSTDEESETPTDYLWAMIKKATGIYAIPSTTGYRESKDISGKARYTWVMFATDENGSSMSDQPDDRSYIGLALHKTTATKGALASQYTWYPMDSTAGNRDVFVSPSTGAISEGGGLYTWIKFADDTDGTNMSNSPVGRAYIGMACHQDSSTESTDAADYDWQLITLNSTTGGIVLFNPCYPGIRQSDGKFIWYQFAADGTGTNIAGTPTNRPYLGLAYDQTSGVQTRNPADYEWDLIDADTSSEVTLKGMDYNDGDFWIDSSGRLRSEVALEQWSRYISPDETGTDVGHIVGEFTSDATNQDDLLADAIAELTKRREPDVTYEIDLIKLPDGLSIGDTVPIVDTEGELYLNARLLQMETCEEKGKYTATFGEFVRVSSTLSDQLARLTAQQREAERYKYTWVVYADTATGDGIRTDPTDASYMGVAYNKSTQTPNLEDPFVYTWSLIGSGATNILSVTWYYILQDESAEAPDAPTDDEPADWTTTEPTYTEGSTDVLYTVLKTTYIDGTFEYGDVSLSSSYAAARAAYEEAVEARQVATKYISADSTGLMVANMADGNTYTPSNVPSGIKNAFIDDDSFDVRDGRKVLASFGETSVIGEADKAHMEQTATTTKIVNADNTASVAMGAQSTNTIDVSESYSTDNEEITITLSSDLTETGAITLTIDSTDYALTEGTTYSYSGDSYTIEYDGAYEIVIGNTLSAILTITVAYTTTIPSGYGVTAVTGETTSVRVTTTIDGDTISDGMLATTEFGSFGLYDWLRKRWIIRNDIDGNVCLPYLSIRPRTIYNTKKYASSTQGTYNYAKVSALANYNVVMLRAEVNNVRQLLVFCRLFGDAPLRLSDNNGTYYRGSFLVDWTNNKIGVAWLNGTASSIYFQQVYGIL